MHRDHFAIGSDRNHENPEQEVSLPRGAGAFTQFPNVVARDKRLDPATLVLLAYRSTFVGDRYGLNEAHIAGVHAKNAIVRPSTGLGINNFRKAIALAQQVGYLKRWQPPAGGPVHYAYAIDRIHLPPCGESGKAGRHLKRAWFDGTLSLDAMAAFIYLRAGTGLGAGMFRSELENRFGWSAYAAGKIVKELRAFGLVMQTTERRSNGQIDGRTYSVTPASLWNIWRSGTLADDPCHGKPCIRTACDIHTPNPPHGLPSRGRTLSHTPKGDDCLLSPGGQRRAVDFDAIRDEAWLSSNLLGGDLEGDSGHLSPCLEVDEATVKEVANVFSDAELISRLRKATRNRISQKILSPAGLYAVRWLAAFAVEAIDDQDFEPRDAVDLILQSLDDRIGKSDPPQWINSLTVIGRRLICQIRTVGDLGESLYGKKMPWDPD